MKISISGREYEADSLGKATLLDTLEMKKQTGMSLGDLETKLKELSELGPSVPDNATPEEVEAADQLAASAIFDSPEHLIALGAFVWLVRRRNGERVSFEEACDFPLDELAFIEEEGDEPAVPADPK